MARHSQPDELARLKGAHIKDPQRYKHSVPKSDLPLGHPPGHLSEDAAECWFEISSLAIRGVLTASDRFVLEVASNYLAAYRAAWVVPLGERSNLCPFPASHMAHLRGSLAEMGFSPSSRTKLNIDPPKDDDDDFEV